MFDVLDITLVLPLNVKKKKSLPVSTLAHVAGPLRSWGWVARKSSFPTQDPGVLECRVRWVSLGRDHLSRAYQFWRHTKPILGATKVK